MEVFHLVGPPLCLAGMAVRFINGFYMNVWKIIIMSGDLTSWTDFPRGSPIEDSYFGGWMGS